MKLSDGGNYTMEALALVSVLFIAGIFIFSHYARQAGSHDLAAQRLAQEVPAAAQAFFSANPDGELTVQALAQGGLKPVLPLKLSVPHDYAKAADWRVEVWHQGGVNAYLVSSKGVTEKYR